MELCKQCAGFLAIANFCKIIKKYLTKIYILFQKNKN